MWKTEDWQTEEVPKKYQRGINVFYSCWIGDEWICSWCSDWVKSSIKFSTTALYNLISIYLCKCMSSFSTFYSNESNFWEAKLDLWRLTQTTNEVLWGRRPVMLTSCQRSFHRLFPPTRPPHPSPPPPWPSLSLSKPTSTPTPAAQPHLTSKMAVAAAAAAVGGPSENAAAGTHAGGQSRKSAGSGLGRFFTHVEVVRRVDLLIQKLCDLPEGSTSLWIIAALLITHHFAKHRSTNYAVFIRQKQFSSILTLIIPHILIISQ